MIQFRSWLNMVLLSSIK